MLDGTKKIAKLVARSGLWRCKRSDTRGRLSKLGIF